MPDYEQLKSALDGIEISDAPALLKHKSRDFYWYSPVLKEQLDAVSAEIVARPKNEAEVIRILKAAYALGVPVTARGGGSGNYGQCMPLSGGLVLDMTAMNQILKVETGRFAAQAGALMGEIEAHVRETSGQELRFFPSTIAMSTIGGFVGGGLGGVGSITWGTLRELGNIRRLRVVTMEAEPRVMDLTGYDLQKVSHAYGTNGVITEVEMPLAPAYDWVDVVVGFDDFAGAARFADAAGHSSGLLLKELGAIAAPAPMDYFPRLKPWLKDGQAIVLVMVAPQSADDLIELAGRMKGDVRFRSDREGDPKRLPKLFEYSWNHTTLRALKIDKTLTYMQVLYPGPDHLDQIARIEAAFGDEMIGHLELIRFDGALQYTGLPMVRFTTAERLDEMVRIIEENGCTVFNPHRYTLEEGGMKQTDAVQLDFKRETDPKGLLNPGKMIGWDKPEHDFSAGHTYMFAGLSRMGE